MNNSSSYVSHANTNANSMRSDVINPNQGEIIIENNSLLSSNIENPNKKEINYIDEIKNYLNSSSLQKFSSNIFSIFFCKIDEHREASAIVMSLVFVLSICSYYFLLAKKRVITPVTTQEEGSDLEQVTPALINRKWFQLISTPFIITTCVYLLVSFTGFITNAASLLLIKEDDDFNKYKNYIKTELEYFINKLERKHESTNKLKQQLDDVDNLEQNSAIKRSLLLSLLTLGLFVLTFVVIKNTYFTVKDSELSNAIYYLMFIISFLYVASLISYMASDSKNEAVFSFGVIMATTWCVLEVTLKILDILHKCTRDR